MNVREVQVYMDSMLVVNQMNGLFKIKNRELWPIHGAIKQLAEQFKDISFQHVPREFNKLADAAVNRALDNELGIGTPEPDPS
jgi:ribonuclease HI